MNTVVTSRSNVMIITKATKEQIKYACLNYHYAKRVPPVLHGYVLFNDNRFCGVITFGIANRLGSKRFNLAQGELLELNRCALNGAQSCTSKCVSLAIWALKRDAPQVKLLVSYADSREGHIGTIYQATNWVFDEETICNDPGVIIDGKFVHSRTISSMRHNKEKTKESETFNNIKSIMKVKPMIKYRYYYALDEKMKKKLESIKKPYPKKNKD